MKTTDTKLLERSALVIADGIVSSIDLNFQTKTGIQISPFGIAWGLAKSLFGNAMQIRSDKATEWVEMVQKHSDVFTKELLENPVFQDAFVMALEKYLIERTETKRSYFRKIFLGFSTSNNLNDYPLEKYIHTLSQLNTEDILTLKDVDPSRQDKNYQVYGNQSKRITNIFNLIFLGILHQDPSSRLGPVDSPFVWMSEFGKEFTNFITG